MTQKARGGLKLYEEDADVVRISSPYPLIVSFFRDAQGVRYMAAVRRIRPDATSPRDSSCW